MKILNLKNAPKNLFLKEQKRNHLTLYLLKYNILKKISEFHQQLTFGRSVLDHVTQDNYIVILGN